MVAPHGLPQSQTLNAIHLNDLLGFYYVERENMGWKTTPNQEAADLLVHIDNLAHGTECIEGTCDRVEDCRNGGAVCPKAYNLLADFANKRVRMASQLEYI